VSHWFDELAKRFATSDHARGYEVRSEAEPPGTFAADDAGLAHHPVSRRSLIAGASFFSLGTILGTRGLSFLSLRPAQAQKESELKLLSGCARETACLKSGYAENKDYVKQACGSPYAGYSGYTDGEHGFKLGCVNFAMVRLMMRVDDCRKICPCPKGKTGCNEECVDLQTDKRNCDACGHKCAAGEGCCLGDCIDVQSDDENCGQCGHVCVGNAKCQKGHCTGPCGDPPNAMCKCDPSADCSGSNPAVGYVCTNTQCDPSNCGACGNVCPDRDLDGDGVLWAGRCQCGTCVNGPGQLNYCGPCCNGVPC
jgi:hypothetical protein